MGWKYNPFTDKLDRTELPGGGNTNQRLTKNDASACGHSWQDKGFSYLTDELGKVLTDELGNALEGKDTIDARMLVNNELTIKAITFADTPYQATTEDDIITADATDGEIIIVLYPLIEGRKIRIKKKDASVNKVKYQGNGFNIDGLSEREISTQYNSDFLIAEVSEWGRH